MKTFKKILSVGATLIMTASMSSVYAEEDGLSQARTQDRVRTELNLQTPASDFGQSQNREEHTVMAKDQNQYQNQHRYMNKYQYGDTAAGKQTMNTQGIENNIWQGNTADSSMNRLNTTNRSMQGNSMTGSMNRYSAASRSMSGGRR